MFMTLHVSGLHDGMGASINSVFIVKLTDHPMLKIWTTLLSVIRIMYVKVCNALDVFNHDRSIDAITEINTWYKLGFLENVLSLEINGSVCISEWDLPAACITTGRLHVSHLYSPIIPRPQFTTHMRTHKTRLFRNRLYIYVFRAIGGQDLRGNVIRFYPRRICLPKWSSLGVGMTWDVYHRYLVARVIFTCHGQRWVIFCTLFLFVGTNFCGFYISNLFLYDMWRKMPIAVCICMLKFRHLVTGKINLQIWNECYWQ